MFNKKYITYASWLAQKHGSPWRLGTNDCMTLLFECTDLVWGTDRHRTVFEKYNDVRSAVKFWRNMKTTTSQQMHLMGFRTVEKAQEMDIGISCGAYPNAVFRHNGYWHGIQEGGVFGAFPMGLDEPVDIWRYKNG